MRDGGAISKSISVKVVGLKRRGGGGLRCMTTASIRDISVPKGVARGREAGDV